MTLDLPHTKSSWSPLGGRLLSVLSALGICAAVVASILSPSKARAAAAQDWTPFVLVAGLLLVGLLADDDGLFEAAGKRLARVFRNDIHLFAAAAVVIAIVTAVLNLDTSTAFLTPVFIHLARARKSSEAPLLYACLFLSNAASLLLPGSNLTNLIVLGHLHLSGASFAARMAPAFVVAVVVTAVVLGTAHRRELRRTTDPAGSDARLLVEDTVQPRRIGSLGIVAVLAATVAVLLLRTPAPWVAAIGVAGCTIRLLQRRDTWRHLVKVLGPGVLAGLFGVAVALGTLGRAWSGPARLLSHLGTWATSALAAVTSIVTNNLPAASLFSAHVPPHPYSLLVGLDLGPNLFVTGSLSALLWLNCARKAGATVSFGKVALLGAFAVPLSMAAALGALALSGSP